MSMHRPTLRSVKDELIKELKMCQREQIQDVSMFWFAEWAERLLVVLEDIEEKANKGHAVYRVITKT